MALADVTAALIAVLASGDPTAAPATTQSWPKILHPVHGTATAEARIARAGRSTAVDVRRCGGTACALVRQIVSVRAAGA
ncbi:hypothetical protein ABZ599_39795 [Streptomyces misionensis]|uniref:hypothetical protein n=1 Tax=Streptomyces misionensis TaxID=67331 RepID=UPI0033E9D2ED